MTPPVYIEAGSGTRRVGDDDFPLTLGGVDADVPLSGVATPEPVALIGTAEGRIFIQSQGAEPVVCNGTPVSTSQWLHDDDLVRIGSNTIRICLEPERTRLILENASAGRVTEPPRIVSERSVPTTGATGKKTIRAVEFKPGRLAESSRKRRPAPG